MVMLINMLVNLVVDLGFDGCGPGGVQIRGGQRFMRTFPPALASFSDPRPSRSRATSLKESSCARRNESMEGLV
jgi:hypothetical protein